MIKLELDEDDWEAARSDWEDYVISTAIIYNINMKGLVKQMKALSTTFGNCEGSSDGCDGTALVAQPLDIMIPWALLLL